MSFSSNSWARLSFVAFSGEIKVDGDLFAVLGINSDKLIRSKDPFSLLPDSVTACLMDGKEIVRDQELSLVIIPGKSGSSNTATLITEKIQDFDLVTDIAGGIVGFAPDCTILQWNKRMTHLFGLSQEDAKGRLASEILPSPVLYDWNSVISSAHLGHEVRIEFRPSGEKRVEGVLSRGGPGVIGLFHDSTESYRTSKRLRALNRLNQAYLQSTGTGLLLLDSRLRVLLSNPGFAKISNKKGSLIGLQLHDILSVESYKWVHDASEHLFAVERAEQTGLISFTDSSGKLVTLRQTLRAVRNQSNQALNFVCLFEDKSDITNIQKKAEFSKENLLRISRLLEVVPGVEFDDPSFFCAEILKATNSIAVAQYLYDSYETLKLNVSSGDWPKGFPTNEPRNLGFPSFVWNGDQQYRITASELGHVSGHFANCIILPIGKGASNVGYLLLADSELSESNKVYLQVVSYLIKTRNEILNEKEARVFSEKKVEHNHELPRKLLDGIPFPVAIIRMDEKIEQWNLAMEQVCGVGLNEAGSDHIRRLIDPDGKGYTLNTRAFELGFENNTNSRDWAVPRKDGSFSDVFRWSITVINSPVGVYAAPVFLVTGILSHGDSIPVGNSKVFIKEITNLFSASSTNERLKAFSHVCFAIDGSGTIEFSCSDGFSLKNSTDSESKESEELITRSSVCIQGRNFHVKSSVSIRQEALDLVLNLFNSCNQYNLRNTSSTKVIHQEMQKYSQSMAMYLKLSSAHAIEQNNAILNFVEQADPLSGFARTMLYSNETAFRVTHLLTLSILTDQFSFSNLHLNKYFSKLHGVFAEKGLRPPSLIFSDKVPSVMIVSDVVLQCFALITQLAIQDGVVSFHVRKSDIVSSPGAYLTVKSLNKSFYSMTQELILQEIESGRFGAVTEVAVLFRILKAAGCSLLSLNNGEAIFFMQATS